jgi:hypothetical protein
MACLVGAERSWVEYIEYLGRSTALQLQVRSWLHWSCRCSLLAVDGNGIPLSNGGQSEQGLVGGGVEKQKPSPS